MREDDLNQNPKGDSEPWKMKSAKVERWFRHHRLRVVHVCDPVRGVESPPFDPTRYHECPGEDCHELVPYDPLPYEKPLWIYRLPPHRDLRWDV